LPPFKGQYSYIDEAKEAYTLVANHETSSTFQPKNTTVDLSKLRLGDALALLEHGNLGQSQKADAEGLPYLQKIIDGLCEISLRDPLTGLFNRRHFDAALTQEIEHVARSGNSALLLMVDIDHFKKINDTHGHLAGDHVLQAVSHCISSCVRPRDTVVRYGGEEFAVILSDCKVDYANVVAEHILKMTSELNVRIPPDIQLHVTVSVGGAFAPAWVRSTAELWIESADTQLYRAKAEGRNRVSITLPQILSVSAEEKAMLFATSSGLSPAWLNHTDAEMAIPSIEKIRMPNE